MFPFGDFAVKESKIFTEKVAELSRIRDMVDPRKTMKTMEACSFIFDALKEECEFEGTMFVDCMGKKAETCLYASIFGIPESLSIEPYDQYAEEGKRLVKNEC